MQMLSANVTKSQVWNFSSLRASWQGLGKVVFKSKLRPRALTVVNFSLVWSSPNPERTIAVAMRRCYSTKIIEEIELELEQKGAEYWKYLLTKCLQDKSLDVLEHFTMTFLLEEAGEVEVGELARNFPYLRFTQLAATDWFLSLNARTLVELWRHGTGKSVAEAVISELDRKKVSPLFNSLAFGDGARAG